MKGRKSRFFALFGHFFEGGGKKTVLGTEMAIGPWGSKFNWLSFAYVPTWGTSSLCQDIWPKTWCTNREKCQNHILGHNF